MSDLRIPSTLSFIKDQHVLRRRCSITVLPKKTEQALDRTAGFMARVGFLETSILVRILSERFDKHMHQMWVSGQQGCRRQPIPSYAAFESEV